MTLFIYYTSYGDKLNVTTLKSSNFHKFLCDAKIETPENKIKYELLFVKETRRTALSFSEFLEILVKVAIMQYPGVPEE